MKTTSLKKLHIKKFRALGDVEIEFGDNITVICGKNGTSKSSILGIAAQIFSFEKDYTKNQTLKYKTITGINFKSQYSDHFRISNKFDVSGSMEVSIELFDGYTQENATAELGLYRRGKNPRPVVRKNSTATENPSRNFTHPVIYLSLKRLYPITDRDYKVCNFEYHQTEFITLTNELLNRSASTATSTTGTIHSAAAHSDNYDQDSVSTGEDNAGQLMLALLSFRKLKEEYSDYKGGLLLIDEADAGLFPAAQIKLVEILQRESQKLNLQVVMTSHSPTLIEHIFEKSQKFQKKFKTIYLSDTYGSIQAMHDKSWPEINADLHTKTIRADTNLLLPRINIYFEDKEAIDLFKTVMYRHPSNKFLQFPDVSLGCTNYIQLATKKIPEFSSKSIICLDGDTDEKSKKFPSIIPLPGKLPPDQLIFEYLFNLPASHPIWKNSIGFARPNLTKIAGPLMQRLAITGTENINLKALVENDRKSNQGKKELRELFKDFYKDTEFKAFLKLKAKQNPWHHWVNDNKKQCKNFISCFIKRLEITMHNGYHVDKSKLSVLNKPDAK